MTHKQRLKLIYIEYKLDLVHKSLYNYERVYESPRVQNAVKEIGVISKEIKDMLKKGG